MFFNSYWYIFSIRNCFLVKIIKRIQLKLVERLKNMSKLQEIRKEQGLTQEDVAKKLNISQQAYALYEKDGTNIPRNVINKIASILMVDATLLDYKDELEDDSLMEFLYKSLTPYHAVKNSILLLENNGFVPLKEEDKWDLKVGGRYYITINGSALIAFKINDTNNYSFNIASCHTDSPCLKVKSNKLISSVEGKRLNVERYGGLLNYSFLDIPLKIAGRVLVETPKGLKQELITSDFTCNIPSLCIHHNPTANSGTELKYQSDMLPLLGECDDLYSKLCPNKQVLDADLFCVNSTKPTFCGAKNEFLVSPRIDNLSSLYSIIKAISNETSKGISILYASDNEEIGSLSKQGAESFFLSNVLKRINKGLKKDEADYFKAIKNGFLLSIDNGHATHPSHEGSYDPVEKVRLNSGVVIKHHPNYSTDAISSSIIKAIAKKKDILLQDYYNHSDIRCGSTIGLITSSQLGINSCDIGLGQLAMHSAIETVGKYDIQRMIDLVNVFFNTSIKIDNDNIIIE